MTLRMPRRGDAPISGKGTPGDLLVRINVTASKDFSRQGNNLYHKTRIPMHLALLGGKVRVPTLDGDVDVRVPGGTQQDEEMVLKGRGVPSPHGGDSGDLFVAFSVQLPRSDIVIFLTGYADGITGLLRTANGSLYNNMRMILRVEVLGMLQTNLLMITVRLLSLARRPPLQMRAG